MFSGSSTWASDEFPVPDSSEHRKLFASLQKSLVSEEYACLIPNHFMNNPLLLHPLYINHLGVISCPIFYACRDLVDHQRNIPRVSYHDFINHATAEKALMNGGMVYSWLIITHYGISGVITLSYPNRNQMYNLVPDPIYIATEYACLVPNHFMSNPLLLHPLYINHLGVISWPIFYACRDFVDHQRNIPKVSYHEFINHATAEKALMNGGIRYSWLIITHYGISGVITLSYPNRNQMCNNESESAMISGISLPIIRQRGQSKSILESVLNHKMFYETVFSAVVHDNDRASLNLLKSSGFQDSGEIARGMQGFFNRNRVFRLPSKSQQDGQTKIRFTYSGREVLLKSLLDDLIWLEDFFRIESEENLFEIET